MEEKMNRDQVERVRGWERKMAQNEEKWNRKKMRKEFSRRGKKQKKEFDDSLHFRKSHQSLEEKKELFLSPNLCT